MPGDPQAPQTGQQSAPTVSQLGPYKLLKKLGEGGMAIVFLAEDTLLQRQVAIKILAPRLTADAGFLARFRREAQAAGQLTHPHIAGAYAVGEEQGLHYYVMEYCEGEPLQQFIEREGFVPWEKAVKIVLELATGLPVNPVSPEDAVEELRNGPGAAQPEHPGR